MGGGGIPAAGLGNTDGQAAHPQPLGNVSSWSLYRVGAIRSLSITDSHESIRTASSRREHCKHPAKTHTHRGQYMKMQRGFGGTVWCV